MLVARRQVKRALVRSIAPTLIWIGLLAVLVGIIPASAWRLKYYGVAVAVGVIGLWRYGWYLLNAARSLWFVRVAFPRLRARAFGSPVRFPRRLFVVVASYKESPLVERLCFSSLVDACARVPSQVTLVVSVGSPQEADEIRNILESREGAARVSLIVTYQGHGKRLALGYALRAVAREFNDPGRWHDDAHNDIVVLMDGDSVVAEDVFEKCLPYFRSMPRIGALTTNEIPVVFKGSGAMVRLWYGLKLSRRHQLMSSHALSGKVLTLTGRFSVFRAEIATSEEFIQFLDSDHLTHWAYGRIRFLMGDDKSTMFCLLKNGWDMLYVPDAYVFCLEDRKGGFFKIANVMMLRWYGNMLRNNGRALGLGLRKMPVFTWLAFLDQRISMWTSLIGPMSAVLLSLASSGYYLVFYAIWVLMTRLVQLWVLVLHGHTLKLADLPLSAFDQWYGSVVKIYCSVNLHEQVWQKSRAEAQIVNSLDGSFGGVRRLLPMILFQLYLAIFVVVVLMTTRLLHFPGLF